MRVMPIGAATDSFAAINTNRVEMRTEEKQHLPPPASIGAVPQETARAQVNAAQGHIQAMQPTADGMFVVGTTAFKPNLVQAANRISGLGGWGIR